MHRFGWYVAKFKCKLTKSREPLSEYYRRGGAEIGKNCCICTDLDECDKIMLTIGEGSTISTQVCFVTHDHSIYHVRHKWGDLWGESKSEIIALSANGPSSCTALNWQTTSLLLLVRW